MSQPELIEMKKYIDDLVNKGWIRPSSSPYGHPVLLRKGLEKSVCVWTTTL